MTLKVLELRKGPPHYRTQNSSLYLGTPHYITQSSSFFSGPFGKERQVKMSPAEVSTGHHKDLSRNINLVSDLVLETKIKELKGTETLWRVFQEEFLWSFPPRKDQPQFQVVLGL